MQSRWQQIVSWDAELTKTFPGYGTPTMTSLEKCLQPIIPKKCLFVDLGSGTGNVLFLVQTMLSEDSQLIGVELNEEM